MPGRGSVLLQHRHNVVGLEAPAHPYGQAEGAVLVDHVEVLQAPPIGGGIELEVHGPELVRVLGLVTPHGAVSQACPLLDSRGGPLQPSSCQRRCTPCGSPSSLPAAAGAGPSTGPSGCAQRRSHRDDDAASPPRWRQPWSDGAVCCGADPPRGRPSAGMPGNAPAGP